MFMQSVAHIAQRIHEIQERVVRRIIRTKIRMHVAVIKVLSTHVVRMVAGRQLPPVSNQAKITRTKHLNLLK